MLDEIIAHKKDEISNRIQRIPLSSLEKKISNARNVRNFSKALKEKTISIIAEVKYRSPSRGIFRTNFDGLEIAKLYAKNGASAISVIADEHFFGGSSALVEQIANDHEVDLPIMYKDFIIHRYQIAEARAAGADAILIIARVLSKEILKQLVNYAYDLGLSVLVETYTEVEIEQAISAGAKIIGVNNRDLSSFKVNLEQTKHLISSIPQEYIKVSESGLQSRDDVIQMSKLGFDAVLVGSSLLESENITTKLNELVG